jgi:serine phosphatase RsbU (regulator of sigma subunit)
LPIVHSKEKKRSPSAWIGYVVTLLTEGALTTALIAIHDVFPLGDFPITYVLVMMAVAYLFGEGPAILAFFVGLFTFVYFFVPPAGIWPLVKTVSDLARLAAFLLGTAVVGFAMVQIRKSTLRVQRLNEELDQARQELQADYEHEHHIAEALQAGLLGTVPDKIGCFRFETLYRAAMDEASIGGDFYDVFPVSEDKVAIVIGDVSGKGLSAAVEMASAKYSLRNRAYDDPSPSRVLSRVNKTFLMESGTESFVTVFAGILDCKERTLTYANGGHEPALMWCAADSEVRQMLPTGPIVGILRQPTYTETTIQLEAGDEILLATDGLVEVKCRGGLLEVDGLVQIYGDKMRDGGMSVASLVQHITDLCVTTLHDDTAVLRVMVDI